MPSDPDPGAPSVLVTVLAYRSLTTIEAAVRSATALRHPGPVVIAVREQGGEAAELSLLAELSRTAPADRPVVVTAGPNLGFAGGHDLLIAAHPGDIVLVLNADAAVDPDLLEVCVPAFADPRVGAVQPRVVRADGVHVDSTGLVPTRSRRATSRDAGLPVSRVDRPRGEVFGVDGCVAVLRRAALVDAAVDGEPYWSLLFAYQEDVELALRLRVRGWLTVYEPAARATHVRAAPEQAGAWGRLRTRRARPRIASVRGFANQRLVQIVHEDLGLLRDPLPFLARELAGWVVLLAAGPGRLEAVRLLLAGLPAAVRRRRAVRRLRERS